MAVRSLVLRKKMREKEIGIEALNERENALVARREAFEKKLDEAKTDDEINVLADEADEIESEENAIKDEKEALQKQLEEIEIELDEIDNDEPKGDEGVRKTMSNVLIREKVFTGMTRTDAELLIKRDDAQTFINELRAAIDEKRAISGGDVLIPEVFLGLIRDRVYGLSKLASKVWRRSLKGTGRYTLAGAIPEAVWTEMCAKLNELTLSFSKAEVDGYKVGGYIAVCNALLEDSDLDLANEVLDQIAQSIAIALDKAILYGTGTKMPQGIVKALEGVADTPNLVGIADSNKGATFYEALVTAFGKAKGHGSTSGKFYAMSDTTFAKLQVKALSMNAAGAIVTGQTMTMPILGGEIVIVDTIPDGTIIGGYGQFYLLAERKEITLARSEHVQFIEDNTVFKGTARYDGKVIFSDAFVAVKIADGAEVPASTDVTFAHDAANV